MIHLYFTSPLDFLKTNVVSMQLLHLQIRMLNTKKYAHLPKLYLKRHLTQQHVCKYVKNIPYYINSGVICIQML